MKTHFAIFSVAVIVTLQADATTIFSHNFTGGTGDLNGTAVDTGSGSWIAGANFDANGNVNATSANGGSATLAFTPVNGLVYTLETSLGALTSTDESWLAFGFAAGTSTGLGNSDRFINNNVIGRAWTFNRGSGGTVANQAWLGNGGSGTANSAAWTTDATTFGGNMDLRIVLDTTGGTGFWTATWFADTGSGFNEIRAETPLLDENINSVGFAVSGPNLTNGSINSFSLTDSLTAIPEPSSMVLCSMGLTGLLLRRRR